MDDRRAIRDPAGRSRAPDRSIPDSVPVVAFPGDSCSEGIGASTKGKRWSTLVSAMKGRSEVSLAEGGSVYTSTYLGQNTDYSIKVDVVAAPQPHNVVVTGGRNDHRASTAGIARAVASSLFDAIKAAAADADLILTSPGLGFDRTPGRFRDTGRRSAIHSCTSRCATPRHR